MVVGALSSSASCKYKSVEDFFKSLPFTTSVCKGKPRSLLSFGFLEDLVNSATPAVCVFQVCKESYTK